MLIYYRLFAGLTSKNCLSIGIRHLPIKQHNDSNTLSNDSDTLYHIAGIIGRNFIRWFYDKWSKIDIGNFLFGGCRVNMIISPLVCSHYTFHDVCPSPRPFLSVHFAVACLHIGFIHVYEMGPLKNKTNSDFLEVKKPCKLSIRLCACGQHNYWTFHK